MTAKNLQDDLKADLLADLAPVEPEPAPVPVVEATLPPELHDTTPSLAIQWTPLRWSRPRVVKLKGGLGKAVKIGPVKVELSVKE